MFFNYKNQTLNAFLYSKLIFKFHPLCFRWIFPLISSWMQPIMTVQSIAFHSFCIEAVRKWSSCEQENNILTKVEKDILFL